MTGDLVGGDFSSAPVEVGCLAASSLSCMVVSIKRGRTMGEGVFEVGGVCAGPDPSLLSSASCRVRIRNASDERVMGDEIVRPRNNLGEFVGTALITRD